MKTTLGRRWLSLFLTLVLCLTLAPAVRAEEGDSVTLSKSTVTLYRGQTDTLSATVRDSGGEKIKSATVTWDSSNTAAVTVDNGIVTAVAPGASTVTATYTGDGGVTVSAYCTVTVNNDVTSITATLLPSSISVFEGDSRDLTPTVRDNTGAEVKGYTITWISDHPNIVGIVENRSFEALSEGTATLTGTISYTSPSSGSILTATVTYTVTVLVEMGNVNFDVTGPIIMDPESESQIKVTTDPVGEIVHWSYVPTGDTDKDAIRVPRDSVGPNHVIYARSPGEGRLTATIGSGDNTRSRTINVEVSGLVLKDEDKTMTVKENTSESLPIPDAYGSAKGARITWQSADPEIAQVTGNTVSGRKAGTVLITGTISGGKYHVEFTVTVENDDMTTIQDTMSPNDQLDFSKYVSAFEKQAGGRLSHLTGLYVDTTQGTLYYQYRSPDEPGAGVAQRASYYLSPAYGQYDLRQITFVPKPTFSGSQVIINYTVVSTTNQVASGRLIITMTKSQGYALDLSATNTEPARFSSTVFDQQCVQATNSGLSYVIFSIPSTSKGILYSGYVGPGNYGSQVKSGAMYRLSDLDDIVFVPAPGVIPAVGESPDTVPIYYTAKSTNGSTYNGYVNVRVTRENTSGGTHVLYNVSKNSTKTLDDEDFGSFTGRALSYIRFDALPTSQEGTLYHNYRSASSTGTRVQINTTYYAGTRYPRLDQITFVPAQDFTGNIRIPFTGWDIDGNRFAGELELNVARGGTGEIHYTGRTAKFVQQDFSTLSRDLTGASLDYIILRGLPDRSTEGSLYYSNSRVSSYGTTQYKPSSGNRISNLSFQAVSGFNGTVEIPFDGYTTSSGVTFSGVIVISSSGSGYVDTTIRYYTDFTEAAVFERDDFDEISQDETGYKVSSVKFTVPSTSQGDLYRSYRSSSSKGTRISSSSTSISASSLDQVAFVPAKNFVGTVYIDYTVIPTNSSKDTFTGTVEIQVERPGAAWTVSYSTRTGPVDFNGNDFRRTGYALRSIQFTSLPSSSEGTVYYQYTSANKYTRVASTNTTYNLTGSNLISDLTFVPREGFSGTVVIPYTGTNSNSTTFYGEVEITVTPPTTSNRFNDLSGYSDQQRAAVSYIFDRGITAGISTTQYGPNLSIRRGDFARMVYIAFNFSPGTSSWVFNDVLPDKYYAQAVNTLYDRGVVSGVGHGDFDPEASVSRQDAICMIQRAMRAAGQSVPDGSYSSLSRYYDVSSVSSYAQGAMAMAVQRGYLPTSGSYLEPRRDLTRMEMAEILYRVLTY